jgi:hypothetical protein
VNPYGAKSRRPLSKWRSDSACVSAEKATSLERRGAERAFSLEIGAGIRGEIVLDIGPSNLGKQPKKSKNQGNSAATWINRTSV